MPWVGYLAVGVAGLLIGWLLSAVLIRRVDALREGPVIADAELAAAVVRHSDTGFVVTDHDGNVLLSNARAAELRAVRAGMCDTRIAAAIARTVVSGEPIDVELDHLDPPPAGDADAVVRAVVEPLAQEWVLVSVVDESAARQVETIRRDFVANVSHELKTPVGAMALLAEAVLDAADDEDAVRHFSAKMLREATRLGALVGELIALSRLQGGIHVQDLAVVEIDGVISESIGRLATVAESAGIDVVTDTPSGLLVRGDRTLLVTALTNLIDNAISYSPPHTSVSVARRRSEHGIEISVTDRGVGIAAEHQRRVFERFFRVDPARSRSTGGTGLGLAIVKHVAANHGGRALLWSKVGTGSTFTLQLPALAGDDQQSHSADPPGPARAAALTPALRTEGAP